VELQPQFFLELANNFCHSLEPKNLTFQQVPPMVAANLAISMCLVLNLKHSNFPFKYICFQKTDHLFQVFASDLAALFIRSLAGK